MAVRTAGGIETGTIYEIVSSGVMPTAVQDIIYSGAWSLKALGTTSATGSTTGLALCSYTYRSFAWRQEALSVSKGGILNGINRNRIFGYNADISPVRYVLMDTSWNVLATGTVATPTINTFFEMEIVVDAGQVTVYVDGVQDFTYDDSGNHTTERAYFWIYGEDEDGKEDYDARYDDFLALDNADGGWVARPNAFMRFDTACAPDADAPGYGGGEWEHLDEIPPGADTYGDEYAAGHADASVPGANFLRAVVLRGQGLFANPERFCIETASEYDLGAYALEPQSFHDEGHWMTQTPGGLAWTIARLNALYWGINLTGTLTVNTNIMYIVYADTAAPGGVDVTIIAVTATATADVPIPIITAIKNVNISAVTATAMAAVPLPTITSIKNVTISAVVAIATADAPIPTISAIKNVTISAVVATADAVAPIPTISAIKNVAVVAVPATAAAAAPVPTILAIKNVTILAVTATATAAAPLPTIAAIKNVNILAVVAMAIAEAPIPSVVIGGTVEMAIYTRLTGYAGLIVLTSTRIYPVILPQDSTYPAITYQRISGPRIHALSSDIGIAHPRIQIDSWGKTYASAKAVATQVRSALQRWDDAGASPPVLDCLLDNDGSSYEPEANIHRVRQDWTIWYRE